MICKNLALALIIASLSAGLCSATEFRNTIPDGLPRQAPIVSPQTPAVIETGKVAAPGAGIPTIAPLINTVEAIVPVVETKVDPIAAVTEGLKPQLEAIAKPETSADASAGAVENTVRILQGGKVDSTAGSPVRVPETAGTAAAPPAKAETSAKPASPAAPAAPAKPQVKTRAVDSVWSYEFRRAVLSYLSRRWGIVLSLPRGGAGVERHALRQAAGKSGLILDFDDTLAPYRSPVPAGNAAGMRNTTAAGKLVIVNTERLAMPMARDVSLSESLSSIPPADRVGIYGSGKKDGLIFKYETDGTPKVIYKEPEFLDEEKAKIDEAMKVFRVKLVDMGTTVHDGSRNIPAESHSGYGKAFMLKIGTPTDVLLKARDVLQQELKARGLPFEVEARFAKSAENPPYVFFSRMDKSWPLQPMMQMFGLGAKDFVVVGDAMYYPKVAKYSGLKGWAARLLTKIGLRLNGGIPAGETGNATDRDMERAVPGALTLSVGGTADPSLRNGYVMPGMGPEQTQKILESVAAGPAPARPVQSRLSYDLRRLALAGIASVWGAVPSLPPSGDRLAGKLMTEAMTKDAVITDYDNTVADNSQPLGKAMAEELAAVRKAGKKLAFVTERKTRKLGPRDVPIVDSLLPIPPQDREGMIVASKTDGRILEYDSQGQPTTVIWEEPPFTDDEKRLIQQAADAATARLPAIGVALGEQYPFSPLSFSFVLAAGTPEAKVHAAGKIFEEELKARGVAYDSESRIARNPAEEPYLFLAKFSKKAIVERIAGYWGITAEQALILGDNFYAPEKPKPSRWFGMAKAVAEQLAGQPIALTGNATDRDMERGLPGALTLSVGGTADPRMANAYVLPGRGPDTARRTLVQVSRRRAGAKTPSSLPEWLGIVAILAFAAAVIGAYVFFAHEFATAAAAFEQQLRQMQLGPHDWPF